MSAYTQNAYIAEMLAARIRAYVSIEDASILRRAERTLRRWAEMKCGDGNHFASWAIERDDEGIPYRVTYPHSGPSYRVRVPDHERGALDRVRAVCRTRGLHFHHQTDPRGCALYVSTEPLHSGDYYSRGIAITV